MVFPAGARLGSYEILSPLGAGGMGEVYRAQDTRLNRVVAIKVLTATVIDGDGDAAHRARFAREAQVISSLHHPHICVLHDIGEQDGQPFLVMEYLEGETLFDRLARGPIALDQALRYAMQIADALDHAHRRAVVHRDLKPSNVMLTRSGAKLLDFGLAKPWLSDVRGEASVPGGQLPTRADSLTAQGMILGTLHYMAPEQLHGEAADARTDLFAFGAVLHEMLTGRRLFEGKSQAGVISSILDGTPDPPSASQPATPPLLDRIVLRALAKDPDERWQSASDLKQALQWVSDAVAPGEATVPPASRAERRPSWTWAVLGVVAVAGLVAGWAFRGRSATGTATPSPAVREVTVRRLTDRVGLEEAPALSPDGKAVAFVASAGGRRHIWVRLIDSGAQVQLTTDDVDHYSPRWSARDALIYYTPGAEAGDQGTIWETPALPGPARKLVTSMGPGDISHDGRSLAFFRFSEGATELTIVARDGTSTRTVAKLEPGLYSTLRWSPDDRRLACLREVGGANFEIEIMVVDVAGGAVKKIAGGFFFQGATWLPDGSGLIVGSAQGSLMNYPPMFNLWEVPLNGSPHRQLTFGEASYEFPDLGTGGLVVSRTRAQADVWKFPITGQPADNVGLGTRITRQTGLLQTLTLSPDESEVAYLSDSGGQANVWIAKVATGETRPLTQEFDPRVFVAVPFWSPRGDWINYLTNRTTRTGDVTLWVARPDGTDKRDLGPVGAWVCWSGDGRWVYYSASINAGPYQIRKVSIDGGAPVTVRDDDAVGCAVAPDGSALYYGKILRQSGGWWDFDIRVARPESAPSTRLARLPGSRIPAASVNFQGYLSPDGRWLAMPLLDGATTNLWALSTANGEWRKLTDFGARNVVIARRIAWSRDGKAMYASVADVDSDIVMFAGLR